MKCISLTCLFLFLASACVADHHAEKKPAVGSATKTMADNNKGWIDLFNGKDFSGWKAVENPDSWRIEDGAMVAHGPRSMLYYVGSVENANFQDFIWECEVKLEADSNSGMYFHTKIEEEGWPTHGYEAQLNNTHKDRRKTGGLYGIKDVMDQSPATDGKWFTQRVTVRGKRVKVYVDGKLITDYAEPEGYEPPARRPGRRLSSGTFALQGHDPGSTVHIRRVRVKLLESEAKL